MMAKPCLQLVGSKVRMAKQIVELLGAHTSYVEPYVGSAAVLLSKEPAPVEIVNDLNEQLIAFYRTLRNPSTRYALIDALTYTPYARKELEQALEDDPSLDDVERARRFMVRTNQRYVGGTGRNWVLTMKGSSGHSNATKWNNYRTRLNVVAERLQNVQIECKDALEVLTKVWSSHDDEIAVYADPPYPAATRSGSKYEEEVSDQHHHDLLDILKRLEGPVVLSTYENDLYREALEPAGWTGVSRKVKASSTSSTGSTAHRTEVLWVNRVLDFGDDEL